jgi:hypothetical protein
MDNKLAKAAGELCDREAMAKWPGASWQRASAIYALPCEKLVCARRRQRLTLLAGTRLGRPGLAP